MGGDSGIRFGKILQTPLTSCYWDGCIIHVPDCGAATCIRVSTVFCCFDLHRVMVVLSRWRLPVHKLNFVPVHLVVHLVVSQVVWLTGILSSWSEEKIPEIIHFRLTVGWSIYGI